MIEEIINCVYWFLSLWEKPIREKQKEYRKSNILNKHDPECDWKDNPFW